MLKFNYIIYSGMAISKLCSLYPFAIEVYMHINIFLKYFYLLMQDIKL